MTPARIVVVSGAPGTGKSTLAGVISHRLQLPLLSLDVIKEALGDALGLGDESWSDRVGDAAAEVMFQLAAHFPSAVAEGWWRRDRRTRAEQEFRGCVQVFCRCDPALAQQRVTARLSGRRHPIHRDVINPAVVEGIAAMVTSVDPLDLDGDVVEVDTTKPYDADVIADRVRSALAPVT